MQTVRKALGSIVFAAALLSGACAVFAGTGYEVTCKTPKCGFKTHAGIGGGMNFEAVAGYCEKCKAWESISWKRGAKAPLPVARFWDPETGTTRRVYKCPKCGEPFAVTEKIEDFKFCPKCKQPGLESKRTILYD